MAAIKSRARMGLASQVFLLTMLLIVVVVVFAVGMGVLQGQRLARSTVDETLTRSSVAQLDFERLRASEVELIAEIIAGDSNITSYIAAASAGEEGTASVADLMTERQDEYEFDLAIVLDESGQVLARTDRPVRGGESLETDPLVSELIGFLSPISAIWGDGDALYQMAMMPLDENFTLIGFLLVGKRIDENLSDEIKRATGTDQIWLGADGAVVTSTLAPRENDQVLGQLGVGGGSLESLLQQSDEDLPPTQTVEISGSRWSVNVEPVFVDDETPVAAVLTLVSEDAILSSHRRQAWVLAGVGLVAILIGLIASLSLSRKLARPLSELTEAASAASAGDYLQHFDAGGSREIVRLGDAFETLLSDLREKQGMEEYVSDLSRFLPDPAFEQGSVVRSQIGSSSPAREQLALLALDYRHMANVEEAGSPDDNVRRFQSTLSQVAALAEALDASLESFTGHRALIGFRGSQAVSHALEFGGHVAEFATDQPSMALVMGQVDRGMVRAGLSSAEVLIGKASHQVDLLLEEASPGNLLFAPQMRDQIDAMLEEHPVSLQVGRLSKKKYFAIPHAELSRYAAAHTDQTLRAERTERAESVIETVARTREIVPGDLFAGRYEIVSILGQGGMGMVYKALDRELEDFVALKTLLPAMATDKKYLNQLKEEIRLARKVTHANVLRTFDFGSHEGVAYISMEYVRGMTLKYLIKQRSTLPYSAGLRITRQVCAGLSAAHRHDVIHRDIKPENIILEANGNAKVMDFGIAQPVQAGNNETLGVFFGTPRYAAPEQMEGRTVDARADIFAVGAVMYEVFAGQTPFPALDMMEIYEAKRRGEFESVASLWTECPPALNEIIARCLAASPQQRFENAEALAAAMARLRA